MRAVELAEMGMDGIKVVDRQQPQPKSDQVLVKLKKASLNFRDFLITVGHYGNNIQLPVVLLSDGSGEVVEAGANVKDLKVGSRVASLFWPNWQDGPSSPTNRSASTGCEIDGVAREYAVFDESAVIEIPDTMSFADAAALPCAALTAWTALRKANVSAGDVVVLQGTGGMSLFGLQFAKTLGCETVVTSSSDEKLDRAKELGADHLINYKTHADWGQKVTEATGGRGAKSVLDVGGAGSLTQSIDAAGLNGHVALIGAFEGMDTSIMLGSILFKNLHIDGITVGHRADFQTMLTHMTEHRIEPIIERSYPLEDLALALSDMTKGSHFGKILIDI